MAIDFQRLEADAEHMRGVFADAKPFPHLVIDDFYDRATVDDLARRFPPMKGMRDLYRNAREFKGQLSDLSSVDAVLREAFDELNSARFVRWLEAVTGIDSLLPDPTNLGGGLHQSGNGMYLDVHADFNTHPEFSWYRRLNVLVYLNETWDETWGGVLELWPPDMSEPTALLPPIGGRMMVFATTSDSFHGYETIRVPDGITRRSLAAYYYTAEPPVGGAAKKHSTLFQRRPGQRRRVVPSGELRRVTSKIRRGIDILRRVR